MLKALATSLRELRQRGWYGLALRLSASTRLPSSLFLLTETEILQLEELNVRALERRPDGYEWMCAEGAMIEGLLQCSPPHARSTLRPVFERFFAAGARCYVAMRDGVIAAYVWGFPSSYVLTYDDYRARNLVIRLDEDSMFLGNGMIDERYRLRGLFPHLMAFVVSQWPHGTRFFSAVDSCNVHSLRSHQRLGFVSCKQILCVTLFGRTWYFERLDPRSRWRRQDAKQEVRMPAAPPASSARACRA